MYRIRERGLKLNFPLFVNDKGFEIPALTSDQMREVDRIAVQEFGLGILQMMENAGRNLANMVMQMQPAGSSQIVVLAGSGGNGGGGICCMRHLLNRGYSVNLFLTKNDRELSGAAKKQLNIIKESGHSFSDYSDIEAACEHSDLIIDAIFGYSLRGAPFGRSLEMIETCNQSEKPVLSLDIPSGVDASSGETPGKYIQAERTLTLALPKLGLSNPAAGKLFLGDIGIPPQVYERININIGNLFSEGYIIPISVP